MIILKEERSTFHCNVILLTIKGCLKDHENQQDVSPEYLF